MKSNGLKKERVLYIDYCRTVGIIAMIIGHIGLNVSMPGWVSHYIHAWHMPIFFVLSGILWRDSFEKSMTKFLKNKVKTLLIPYIIWGLFSWIIYIGFGLLGDKSKLQMAITSIKYIFTYNTEFFPISGAMWFLTAMFVAQLFYAGIRYVSKRNMYITGILVIIVAFAGWYYSEICGERLILGIDSAMISLPFMFVGHMIGALEARRNSSKKIFHTSWQVFVTILLFAVSIWGIGQNEDVNLRTLKYGNVFLFYVNAVISCMAIISFMRIIEKYFKNKVLSYVGENSIVYLIFNQLILAFVYRIFDKVLATECAALEVIISLIIVLGCCTVLYELLNMHIPYTIGKAKVERTADE